MLILKINVLTNLLAFIIGIFLYKSFSKEIKIVFYFVIFGLLIEILARLYLYFITKNAMPFGHFYFPIAFLILSLFYSQILKDFIKPVYIISMIVFYETYCVINSLFIQSFFEYPSIEGAVGAIIIFLFSIVYFTKVMIEGKIVKLAEEPLIWINSAILMYYTGSFFYHALYNLRISASLDIAILALKMFSVLNILFYLIIAIGFLKVKKIKPTKVGF